MKRDLCPDAELEAGAVAPRAGTPCSAANSSPQRVRHEPFYDINPRTGASFEVFWADRALETFGRCGAGWFWWSRRRGFAPQGLATGPFSTSYAAYRSAMNNTDENHFAG